MTVIKKIFKELGIKPASTKNLSLDESLGLVLDEVKKFKASLVSIKKKLEAVVAEL